MNEQRHLVYLGWRDLEALEISYPDLLNVISEALLARSRGQATMPPMTFFDRGPGQWYHLTMSWIPSLGFAAAKFQSGDFSPGNTSRPTVQGLIVLCDDATGDMIALMDARWITGARTAAASALVAREQARKGATTLAILGCGLQGRMHLPAIKGAVPSINRCRVYDVSARAVSQYVADLDGKFGVKVEAVDTVEQLVRGADVVVTAGPILGKEHKRPIVPEWLAPGSLTIAIDFGSYLSDAAIEAMDLVVVDDSLQFESKQRDLEIFTAVQNVAADLPELLSTGRGRRQRDDQRIGAMMIGLPIEDLAAAVEAYRRAMVRGIGTLIPV